MPPNKPALTRLSACALSAGGNAAGEFTALKSPSLAVYPGRCHRHLHARVAPRCEECVRIAAEKRPTLTSAGRVAHPHFVHHGHEEDVRKTRIQKRLDAFHRLKTDAEAAAPAASAGAGAGAGAGSPKRSPSKPLTPSDMGRSLLQQVRRCWVVVSGVGVVFLN